MKQFLVMLKLYSVQVILFLASLNTVIALMDAPGWLVAAVNIAGVIAHHIARAAPQPVVEAQVDAVRSTLR